MIKSNLEILNFLLHSEKFHKNLAIKGIDFLLQIAYNKNTDRSICAAVRVSS